GAAHLEPADVVEARFDAVGVGGALRAEVADLEREHEEGDEARRHESAEPQVDRRSFHVLFRRGARQVWVRSMKAVRIRSSAATTGPSSRTSESATSTPIDSVAPYFCSVWKPCSPSTIPTNRPDTTMITSDSTPLK